MKKMFLLPAAVLLYVSAFSQVSKEVNKEMRTPQVATSAIPQTSEESAVEINKTTSDWEQQIKETLKLTDEQKVQLEKINKEFNAKTNELKTNTKLSEAETKEKNMLLLTQKEKQFVELLTPDQLSIYKTMMEKKNKEKPIQVLVD